MTSATDPGSPEGTEGDAWARTVLDGVTEREQADADSRRESPAGEGPDGGDAGGPATGDAAATGHRGGETDPADADTTAGSTGGQGPISVEDLVADLERVSAERDQYLDTSRRIQAEFENYKKQVAKRESDARERANDSLVGDLLPVLDAFDGALASGADDVAPMRTTFLDTLLKLGLERIEPAESPFDPSLHEAVIHEDDPETDGPVVAEVMRAGYVWKGRVLRPAMVKTRG